MSRRVATLLLAIGAGACPWAAMPQTNEPAEQRAVQAQSIGRLRAHQFDQHDRSRLGIFLDYDSQRWHVNSRRKRIRQGTAASQASARASEGSVRTAVVA